MAEGRKLATMVSGAGSDAQKLREAAQARLAKLDAERHQEAHPAKDRIDILWGWKEIAKALGVSVRTAQALEREEGLPIIRRRGKSVQTTREALQQWAQKAKNPRTWRDTTCI